jgi:hypothetical protein
MPRISSLLRLGALRRQRRRRATLPPGAPWLRARRSLHDMHPRYRRLVIPGALAVLMLIVLVAALLR